MRDDDDDGDDDGDDADGGACDGVYTLRTMIVLFFLLLKCGQTVQER